MSIMKHQHRFKPAGPMWRKQRTIVTKRRRYDRRGRESTYLDKQVKSVGPTYRTAFCPCGESQYFIVIPGDSAIRK